MSGVSAKCYATKWHHRCGSNRNDVDDRAKQRDLIRLCLNDREGDLANIPCLIRLCPNGHAVALVRSLEHVHRLVGFYQPLHKGLLSSISCKLATNCWVGMTHLRGHCQVYRNTFSWPHPALFALT